MKEETEAALMRAGRQIKSLQEKNRRLGNRNTDIIAHREVMRRTLIDVREEVTRGGYMLPIELDRRVLNAINLHLPD